MANQTDYLIRGSDNIITMTLTEAGSPIAVTWTEINIVFGGVTITRASNGNGVTFTAGVLEITPGSLTETLTSLVAGSLHRVQITVLSAQDTDGVVFGGDDSDNQQYFLISDVPA